MFEPFKKELSECIETTKEFIDKIHKSEELIKDNIKKLKQYKTELININKKLKHNNNDHNVILLIDKNISMINTIDHTIEHESKHISIDDIDYHFNNIITKIKENIESSKQELQKPHYNKYNGEHYDDHHNEESGSHWDFFNRFFNRSNNHEGNGKSYIVIIIIIIIILFLFIILIIAASSSSSSSSSNKFSNNYY